MIEVEEVRPGYLFPTIDFKFRNPDNTSAIISELQVEIIEACVDLTPDLDFSFDKKKIKYRQRALGTLVISTRNIGWGAAKNFQAVVKGALFEQLFSLRELTFNGEISSGEGRDILFLRPDISVSTFHSLYERLRKESREELTELMKSEQIERSLYKEIWKAFESQWTSVGSCESSPHDGKSKFATIPWIPVNLPAIQWSCVDEKSQSVEGRFSLKASGQLYLSCKGFKYLQNNSNSISAGPMASDVTYCVIANPAPQTRRYAMSRCIAGGGVERFHIMLGATKSCKMSVRFRFKVNHSEEAISNIFDIQIRNPIGSNFHHHYEDGNEIFR